MLSELFKCPVRLQQLRSSHAGASLEGFACQLCQIGYSTFTAKEHVRVAEHFAYWTDREGIALAALNNHPLRVFSIISVGANVRGMVASALEIDRGVVCTCF